MRLRAVAAATVLPCICTSVPAARVTYEPTWESLDSRPTPAWWGEQKFSLFMHWGLYAVPAFCPVKKEQSTCYAEHFWDNIHPMSAQQQYMRRVYGSSFRYQDFAPLFRCENFDAAEWAELFRASGAQGLTMTSKHHEGWTLWGSARHANWNAVDTGPHRDLLREVRDAVRARGLRWGVYYSLLEWDRAYTNQTGTSHWTEKGYVNGTMLAELRELAAEYQPDVLYVDGEWDYPSDHWNTKPFLAWLFNDSPIRDTVAVNDRWGNDCRGKHGGFYVCEYSGEVNGSCITDQPTHPWTSHEGMGKSFGYNRIDEYKSSDYFVGLLAQSVANGGHLQLNVGPTADGRIPHPQSDILRDVGAWLQVNGAAIYNTTGFPFGVAYGGCADVGGCRQCYTSDAAGELYVTTIGWPSALAFREGALRPTAATNVTLLGVGEVKFTIDPDPSGGVSFGIAPVGFDRLPRADTKVGVFAFRVTGAAALRTEEQAAAPEGAPGAAADGDGH